MSNIIKTELPATVAVEISEGKRRQYYRDCNKALLRTFTRGMEDEFTRAAMLWNIRENKLHELDGLTFEEYAKKALGMGEKGGIGRSTLYAYLQVGTRIRTIKNNTGIPVITQKDLKEIYDASNANKQDYTLRGLFKAAQDQSQFQAYLNSGKLEELKTETTKLLKARKLTAEELDKQVNDERVRAESADRAKTRGYAFASQHGIVWDTITKDWKNEDGTPLNDKQRAEMTKFSDAIAPLERIREHIADVSAEVYKIIHSDGEAFRLFSTRANKNFANEAHANRRTITLRLESLQTMLSFFYEGEVTKAEQEYRNSIQ